MLSIISFYHLSFLEPLKMSITTNIQSIRTHIPGHVRLVCVSKFNPNESIAEAYASGERIFGDYDEGVLADYVLTDSFHGMAFSIIFEKQA